MSVTSETELIFSSSALTLNHKQICRSLAQFSDQETPSEVLSTRDLNPGHQCEKLQHFHCASLPIQKLFINISDIVSHQTEKESSRLVKMKIRRHFHLDVEKIISAISPEFVKWQRTVHFYIPPFASAVGASLGAQVQTKERQTNN